MAGTVGAATLAGTVPAGAATRPALVVEAARHSVTLYRYDYDGEVYMRGDLGLYAVADVEQRFEVHVTRPDYDHPVVARAVRKGRDLTLPVPADFSGLTDFSRMSVYDAKDKLVSSTTSTFCPNGYEPVRRSPKAPATSPYPQSCSGNPYSLGAVWGLQAGYAASLVGDGYGYYFDDGAGLPDLEPGDYRITVSVTPAYRQALHIPASQAQATVFVTVKKGEDCDEDAGCRRAARSRAAQGARATPATAARITQAPARLSGSKIAPTGPLPDLRSLPAWGIDYDGRYLNFGATVWNAGPGRLVVDGFRDPEDDDLMNAYQYFFSASGKQQGYAPVGGMEWDARKTHNHWHFKDFASYSLVSADGKTRIKSGKEAFCLANTDAVDYTVKGAAWRPGNTDLSTACGEREALGVREVLDTGSGDTYSQYREGQAFDLKDVANGTYYIEVAANPDHVLYETSTANNVSRRQVVISGSGKHRSVAVAQVGLVVEPPVGSGEESLARHGG